jgi:hypothetical protein
MYRNITSLQQQNAISSCWGESVRNSEQDLLREPREDARMRMAQVNGEQSRCHRRSKGGHRFCAKNDEVAQSRSGSDRRLNASDCGKGISLFPFFLLFHLHIWRRQNPTCRALHATFVPWRGIFRRGGLHLTNLGAAARASCARPFGFAQDRTAEGGCPYVWVAVPKVAVHICGFSMIPGRGLA